MSDVFNKFHTEGIIPKLASVHNHVTEIVFLKLLYVFLTRDAVKIFREF